MVSNTPKSLGSLKLLLIIVPIMLSGLVSISNFGVNDQLFHKQLIWIIISILTFIALSRINYDWIKSTNFVMIFYIMSLILLTLTVLLGKVVKGSQAWISLGFASFQAADFAKLVLIILLAKYFSKRHVEIGNIRHILVSGVYAFIPFALIMLQPDLGSGLVILSIWGAMVLVSGIQLRHLALVLGFAAASFALAWVLLFAPYQKSRILNFIDPLRDVRGSGYNAYQSIIAVGNGGPTGTGVGYGTQSRLNYLPEHQTDFIFAAFAEEWGFVGAAALLLLITIMLVYFIYLGYVAKSNFETLFTYGVVFWFITHTTVNVGMNLGLLPVTGLPLPFMSYGGSHLLSETVAAAMVMGMSSTRKSIHRSKADTEIAGLT